MPSMDIQVLEGVFSEAEKAQLISAVTEAFASVAGETIAGGLSVRIHEVQSGSWGYGGRLLSTAYALEMKSRG